MESKSGVGSEGGDNHDMRQFRWGASRMKEAGVEVHEPDQHSGVEQLLMDAMAMHA